MQKCNSKFPKNTHNYKVLKPCVTVVLRVFSVEILCYGLFVFCVFYNMLFGGGGGGGNGAYFGFRIICEIRSTRARRGGFVICEKVYIYTSLVKCIYIRTLFTYILRDTFHNRCLCI